MGTGLAVDGSHIYWSMTNSIGGANLDGSGVDPASITGEEISGVAVDANHIYWAGQCIGRANLDGSAADGCFIDVGADAVAVGPGS